MEKSSQQAWKGALPDMGSGRGTLGGEIGANGILRAFWGHKMMRYLEGEWTPPCCPPVGARPRSSGTTAAPDGLSTRLVVRRTGRHRRRFFQAT
ncbi:hypothetical protein UB51_02875 [Paenibacillus sp. IHBB 10380]|nr:hypothetical protein UB51_02875 [Paenibacillus sp. IHBB 10380]